MFDTQAESKPVEVKIGNFTDVFEIIVFFA